MPARSGSPRRAPGVMPPMITSVVSPKRREAHSSNGIVVKGVDDVLVRLSRCCNPVPGDKILGFVTRGRGVSVHRADCPNAEELMKHPERIIEVEWEKSAPSSTSYKVEIYIEAIDRLNLLRDVTVVLSDMGANVLSCNTISHRDGMVEMRFLFQVSDISLIDAVPAQAARARGRVRRSSHASRARGEEEVMVVRPQARWARVSLEPACGLFLSKG